MNRPTFTLHQACWSDYSEELIAIRRAVFIDEQQVSEEEEIDGLDPEFNHVLCRQDSDQKVVACARISAQGKIGRVAVLKDYRSSGVGSLLMKYCAKLVQARGQAPYLDAQLTAIPFYERLGYRAEGEVFMDANIPHKRMRLLAGQ